MQAKEESVEGVIGDSPVGLVTEVRSTMIVTSLQILRDQGFLDRYRAVVDPRYRDALFSLVAGVWVDGALIDAHYGTCDRLGLTSRETVEMGRLSAQRLHNAVIQLVFRAAGAAGATPWMLTRQLPKMWARSYRGGGIAYHRIGAKDARIQILGYPCAAITYARVAWRGVLEGGIQLLEKRARVIELPAYCTATTLGYRVTWD